MKAYVTHLVAASVIFIGLLVTVNKVIDPFWIYDSPLIYGLNKIKPELKTNQRVFEITRLLNKPPQILILGTSREDSGISPDYPLFGNRKVFNAAIASQPYIESNEIIKYLINNGNSPSLVLFGLLFESANIYGPPLPSDFSNENFSNSHKIKLLFSLDTTKAAVATVKKNITNKQDISEYTEHGFKLQSSWENQLRKGHRQLFLDNEKHYLFDNHFPAPGCKNVIKDEHGAYTKSIPMNELQELIAIAYRAKIDMRLFIGPSHARQWETIGASGLWEQFEDWKRMLVELVESEAIKENAIPFQLWDFSGYNSVTQESVPEINDLKNRMRFYYESSHYTPEAGELVINRILGDKGDSDALPNDFGELLTKRNIELYLSKIRTDREIYRKTHSRDILEIEGMLSDVNKNKRCIGQQANSFIEK